MDAHLICKLSYRKLGDTKKAEFHQYMFQGLLNSILKSGDGTSYEKAFIVIGVPEEWGYFT